MKRVDHMIKYLSGELTKEDTIAFEKELKNNPELKEEFSEVEFLFNLMGEELKKKDEEDFRSALQAAGKKSGQKTNSQKKPLLRPWHLFMAIAASLAVLLSIFSNRQGSEKLFSSYYHPDDDPVIETINENIRGESKLKEIYRLWRNSEYKKCEELAYKQLHSDNSDQFTMLLYLLSSMEIENEKAALDFLSSFEINTENALGQAITWYKALAKLKLGETNKARELLSLLSENPGPYQVDAGTLEKKLKN